MSWQVEDGGEHHVMEILEERDVVEVEDIGEVQDKWDVIRI